MLLSFSQTKTKSANNVWMSVHFALQIRYDLITTSLTMPTFEVTQEPEVARLVSFSTGQVIPEMKDGINFKCFGDSSNKRKLSVTTSINSIEYSGQNFGPSEAASTDNCDYYIAVQRKGSEKVQILPAALFRLNPKMDEEEKGSSSDDEPKGTEQEERLKAIQKFHDLTSQFGSGKSQKAMKKAVERKVDDGVLNLMSQSVPTTPRAAVTRSEEVDSSEAKSSVVPAHNKDAEKPADVYLLETIIPFNVMEPLREQSETFINSTQGDIAKWRKEKTYSKIVLNFLENLPLSSDERASKASLIMYLHCLMHCHNLKASQLGPNRYPSEWRGLVKKLLDENFTLMSKDRGNRERRLRPIYLKDLLLSHIMILYMRLNDYSIPLTPLIEYLGLKLARVTPHAKTLGFTVSGTVDKVAKLKVPFKLPDTSRRGQGKSR